MKEISVIIDGKKIKVPEGATVLRAAADNGIEIPNLCFDGRVELYGACGLCVVEAEGIPKLLRACSTKLNEVWLYILKVSESCVPVKRL